MSNNYHLCDNHRESSLYMQTWCSQNSEIVENLDRQSIAARGVYLARK